MVTYEVLFDTGYSTNRERIHVHVEYFDIRFGKRMAKVKYTQDSLGCDQCYSWF